MLPIGRPLSKGEQGELPERNERRRRLGFQKRFQSLRSRKFFAALLDKPVPRHVPGSQSLPADIGTRRQPEQIGRGGIDARCPSNVPPIRTEGMP